MHSETLYVFVYRIHSHTRWRSSVPITSWTSVFQYTGLCRNKNDFWRHIQGLFSSQYQNYNGLSSARSEGLIQGCVRWNDGHPKHDTKVLSRILSDTMVVPFEGMDKGWISFPFAPLLPPFSGLRAFRERKMFLFFPSLLLPPHPGPLLPPHVPLFSLFHTFSPSLPPQYPSPIHETKVLFKFVWDVMDDGHSSLCVCLVHDSVGRNGDHPLCMVKRFV